MADLDYLAVKRAVKIFLLIVFGFSIMALSLPIIIPIFGVFWILSQVSYLVLKVKYGKTVNKPDGMDIVNGKENDISKPYINIIGRFTNKNPDIEHMRRRFKEIVLDKKTEKGASKFKKFTQIFTQIGGYYVWKDADNFSLKNHLRIIDTKEILERQEKEDNERRNASTNSNLKFKLERKDKVTDLSHIKWETILRHFLCLYGDKPVKEGCPKWEILILSETENRFTCLFRVHHSITDGIYFVRLIAECLADYPVEVRLPYNYKKPSLVLRMLMNVMSFSLLPWGLFRVLRTSDRNPLHGIQLQGVKKFFMSETISLEVMREIKRGTKVTVNDIIFSCVSHATAAQFSKRNTSVEKINVLLAVNLQEMNQPLRLKNDFAVTVLKIPTSSTETHLRNAPKFIIGRNLKNRDMSKYPSLTRLQIVKNALEEAKNDPTLMALCWLITSFSSLLPACVAEALLSTKGVTMDISNVQGPQNNDLVIDAAPAIDVAFFLPDRDPLGIAVSIVSYNGYLRVGLTVDQALISSDEEGSDFLSNFQEEVHNLHREVTIMKLTHEKEVFENSLLRKTYKNIP